MATIVSIKQKIEQLDAGSFQVLCDAYLSREGYPNPVSLGTKAGTQKTTQGTPDTYFCLANGKYVLAEYTTQRPGLAGKIRSDLEKCFDSQLSGINNDDITEIIYCHTSSGIDAGADKSLKRYCQDKGVQLTMIGIDKLAEDISRKYPILAKEHLGLSVDTEQIQDPLDFVRQYDASALAAPLNTNFLFRENEIVRLQKAFDENNVVILSGAAGTGKTRLALEFAERFQKEHTAVKICVIHNHGLPIYDDLKQHFECPGDYFVIVDDANQLSQLDLIIEYVNKKDNGYNVRILATVRNYALQKVKADIAGIVHYSEVTLDSLSDDEIKSLVKDYLGIINRDYLNRIATIAEGNARIALIAGKVAVDANTHNIESALDLFFDYYLKRPDLYIQFYHATNLYFGIKPSSLQKGFYTQIQLIQHFINYSDNWNNPFIRILFFETAKNLLQVYFSPAEAGRRGDSFVIYHFSLPTTEQAVMYRKLIWEQLLAIQGTIDSKESIRALLQDYARSVEESSFGLIKEDAPYICELFQSVFSPESVTDCILAEHVNSILSVVGYTAAEIEVFLKSRKLSIYHILIGPRWENFKSLDRHENEHKRVITDYFTQAENTLDAFNELFEVYREYIACDPPVMKTFIFVPDNIKHKSDAWIKHYISKYNTDYEKMESLFSVLSELCDDRKKDYISYVMTVNADPELFRRIPLCPTSYSWSGSAVPLYSKWADYLKGLLPLFSGIQFLQHQKVVNDEIEHLSKMIERAEIEDLLQG